MSTRVYADYAATTPICTEARQAMAPWLEEEYGNPSSLYLEGRRAKEAIDKAREIISQKIHSLFAEVIFTSSGTEAVNLALLGSAIEHLGGKRDRILISSAEHHCAIHCAEPLRRLGYQVDLIPVDREAMIDMSWLEDHLDERCLSVCAMHANNEIGTIQPIRQVLEIAKPKGVLVICDAVQTFCARDVKVDEFEVDYLALSAHKVYGPKGNGAIYIRAGNKPAPLLYGGAQERELRAGTENVAGIVGFSTAVEAYGDTTAKQDARDRFVEKLKEANPLGLSFSTPNFSNVLDGHCHLRFAGISAESMLIRLDQMGVSASAGAACSSGGLEPSHVLLAAGWSPADANEGLRFSFGNTSTIAEAELAASKLLEAAEEIRRAKDKSLG